MPDHEVVGERAGETTAGVPKWIHENHFLSIYMLFHPGKVEN